MTATSVATVLRARLGAAATRLGRHVTFLVAVAAMLIIGAMVYSDAVETRNELQVLARIQRRLDDTVVLREDLAALETAQSRYTQSRTATDRRQRDGAVMELYVSVGALRGAMPDGEQADGQWGELSRLVTQRIDDCLAESEDQPLQQWRRAYFTATRVYEIVQRVQDQQLARWRREQRASAIMNHANDIELAIALVCSVFALIAVEAIAHR